MEPRRLAILLPSAYRPRELARCLDSLSNNLPDDAIIVTSVVEDDVVSMVVLTDFGTQVVLRSHEEYERGAVYGWNQCLTWALDCEVYVLAADDLVFSPESIVEALAALERMGGGGLVGFNDRHSDGETYAAHWLADRQFLIEHNGGVMYPPMYRSWWADREVTDKAKTLGRYAWARAAIVEHHNYTFGKSEID